MLRYLNAILPGCILTLVLGLTAGLSGCVMVNPSNVHVFASPGPAVVPAPSQTVPHTPYGDALERAIKQEERVVKELQKQDWKDLAKESAEWTRRLRILSGYADTSADPAKFRRYCERMLEQTQLIQDAALRYDAAGCQDAIRTIDPLLSQFTRDFPVAVPPAARPAPSAAHLTSPAGASRAPVARPSATPQLEAAQRRLIP
jgi:hypothetical protein